MLDGGALLSATLRESGLQHPEVHNYIMAIAKKKDLGTQWAGISTRSAWTGPRPDPVNGSTGGL
jgi:hypothetical protein